MRKTLACAALCGALGVVLLSACSIPVPPPDATNGQRERTPTVSAAPGRVQLSKWDQFLSQTEVQGIAGTRYASAQLVNRLEAEVEGQTVRVRRAVYVGVTPLEIRIMDSRVPYGSVVADLEEQGLSLAQDDGSRALLTDPSGQYSLVAQSTEVVVVILGAPSQSVALQLAQQQLARLA